ncbi:hypothetical protein G6011_04668 [Alternaria panax]|uniref:N-acetylgalactosaminide beta-1,3-galactosyltransferase n=1 Tax=Alternaria panax TaxID=48097 RepID=A0AAD4NU94_9PLEO|nr:hypothetical protein G6011_04668 [Alternaria panax]
MRRDFRNEKAQYYAPRRHSSPVGLRRRSRRKVLLGVAVCFLIVYQFLLPQHEEIVVHSEGTNDISVSRIPLTTPISYAPEALVCPDSAIVNDVLVVLRTGATEALEKLPVHFETTLRCVPDYIVYSDLKEEIQGHQIHDVLEGTSDELRASAPEFKLYDHLRTHGREGLKNTTHLGSGPDGALDNPSWKLDRFKFLPMVHKALEYRPSAKWFVFIEADTYMVWQNMLEYLTQFDPNQPFYIGKHMYIGQTLFAHGGSGFVLSSAAIRKVVERRNANLAEYDEFTAKSWAGDMVLAKALKDVSVDLFWAFPHFQGEPVSSLDHNVTKLGKTPWCYAPITYHHMQPTEIRNLWTFEQTRQQIGKTPPLHRDIFKEYILPELYAEVNDWDNLSMDVEADDTGPFEACRLLCESKPKCLQFSYAVGKCSTSARVVLGESAKTRCVEYSSAASKCVSWQEDTQFAGSIQSGWMMDRLEQYVMDMDSTCGDEDEVKWIL